MILMQIEPLMLRPLGLEGRVGVIMRIFVEVVEWFEGTATDPPL